MKRVLVIGAGRSATSLIDYLLEKAEKYDWFITVADASLELATQKVEGRERGKAVALDALNSEQRAPLVQEADVVVSMLPPFLHHHVAGDCVKYGKHMATASYVSNEVRAFDQEAKEKGLLILGELGLDPGIDHMSAMQMIDHIKEEGGEITSFKSAAGGLVAPESDTNPWHYKFSWSPRNVVLAGQGIAKYMYKGQYKHVTYHRLFDEVEAMEIPAMEGEYEAYPNRVSLKYNSVYGLENTPTVIRQTIRYKGYCRAWNLLVHLGLTDDSYKLPYSEELTYASLIRSFLPEADEALDLPNLRARVAHHFNLDINDEALDLLEWLDIFKEIPIAFDEASPAEILQSILEYKWKLKPEDKDMIIMQHDFEYKKAGQDYRQISTMVFTGENAEDTAMAKLVGLPLAMGVKNILLGNISVKGVNIPILPEIYNPIMKELADYGVEFKEVEMAL